MMMGCPILLRRLRACLRCEATAAAAAAAAAAVIDEQNEYKSMLGSLLSARQYLSWLGRSSIGGPGKLFKGQIIALAMQNMG